MSKLKYFKSAVYIILICILPVLLNAYVFDLEKLSSELFAPDMTAVRQGALTARINGNPVVIESYMTGKSADEIMQYYADNCRKSGYKLINGKEIARLGAYLANMGLSESPDRWYYLFYRKKNGDMSMITAGELGRETRIVIVKINKINLKNNTGGFDDRINHCPGFDKVLGIEILSGKNLIGFANFYRSEDSQRYVVRSYYEYYLPKNKWVITRQYTTPDTDMFMIEKQGKGYMLNIYPTDNGDKWVTVMG